ncbi:TonB-dependent receptor [Polymorphobacter multimanifer]|uniref:Iron complex outermembrane receptor protein n=1 Tax=Polymorphobacter multimanifer TaxID=1070431 RepID=A0A841L9A1_9SPHN|nr:TonB-dependent receptor [Polymorphobacter multimanifer]MBB6229000.1 iron complex outermembrane receptor protein [Polymorphobacter multimanifer]GGI78535.1 TonB-dependent receptor [Polymorphobacter multimanifer]
MADIFNLRSALVAGVALAALVPATPVFAQAADTMVTEEDEIIVSARRRDERLIDVPVAVSAYSQADLERLQAIDLAGIQGTAPNLNIVQGRGSATSANIFIRGIGQPDALQTFDPAVGVYVDGVYLSRIQGALLSLGDVERIEVLRGPQGTLYGKNTIGGAVSIISRKPDLNVLKGQASALYGSYNQILLNGYLSAPLAADKLALSVAAQWDKRDGIVTDPRTGRKYNDRDSLTGRAILRAQPTERLELLLSGDYTRQRNALTLGYATAPLAGIRPIPANPYGQYDYKASTSFRGDEGQRLDHWGTSLTANFELSDAFTLSSITAYRKLRPDLFIDIDATEAELGDVFVGIAQEQFSQELQLKWNTERFSGVVGLYYLDEVVRSHQEAYADDLLGIPFTRLIDDRQRTRSYAAFGQATYDLTDQFAVTAGLRYTHEDRVYDRLTTVATSAAFQPLFPPFSFPGSLPAPFNNDNKASFGAWTPTLTLSFKPTPDTLLYGSASRGFKSGGFNGRANSINDLTVVVGGVPTIVTQFRPETVWTYEGGAKGSFMNGRVRLSANAFLSDYKDFQARVGGGSLAVFPVLNAGELRIWGLEGEAAVRPTDRWNVRVSVGYLNAEYREFNDGRRPPTFSCNPTGNAITCEPAFAPPLTLTLGSDYTIPLGSAGGLTFGGDGRFVDAHFLSVDNRSNLREPGYWVANAFVQFDSAAGWYLRGGVKNLSNSLYRTDGQEFSSVGNIQTVYFGDPRTWNATVGFRF